MTVKEPRFQPKKWIESGKWNKDDQCVKGNNDEAREINQFLNLMRGDIEKIYLRISTDERIPSPDEIKSQMLGEAAKPTYKTICEAFDYHNLKMSELAKTGKVTAKTLLRYKITKNKVVAFMQQKFNKSDQPLPELRLAFITEFEHYLLTKDKLQNNTAHKYIKNLKKIMNMSVGLDWIDGYRWLKENCII